MLAALFVLNRPRTFFFFLAGLHGADFGVELVPKMPYKINGLEVV